MIAATRSKTTVEGSNSHPAHHDAAPRGPDTKKSPSGIPKSETVLQCGGGIRPPKVELPSAATPETSPKTKPSQLEAILDLMKKVLELMTQLVPLFAGMAGAKSNGARPAGKGKVSSGGMTGTEGPGVSFSGGGQFLWKPKSDKDGKLAILLPPNMTGKVSGVSVVSPSGEILEKGSAGGVGNGGREHFRFRRQGSDFPDGSVTRISMIDGSVKEMKIKDSAKRLEA